MRHDLFMYNEIRANWNFHLNMNRKVAIDVKRPKMKIVANLTEHREYYVIFRLTLSFKCMYLVQNFV